MDVYQREALKALGSSIEQAGQLLQSIAAPSTPTGPAPAAADHATTDARRAIAAARRLLQLPDDETTLRALAARVGALEARSFNGGLTFVATPTHPTPVAWPTSAAQESVASTAGGRP